MRVRFDTDLTQAEIGLQLATMRATTEFWRIVQGCLDVGAALDPARRALSLIDSDLELEELDRRSLVVRASGDGSATPMAERVAAAVPAALGLSVASERAPVGVARAARVAADRTGIDLSQAEVRVGVGRGHLLDIVVRSPLVSSVDDERAREAAQLLCALCLGDQVFRQWVGAVDVEPAPKSSPLRVLQPSSRRSSSEWLGISDLVQTVDVGRRRVVESVGNVPCHRRCEAADWVMLELESAETPSSDGVRLQDDLVLACTMVPEAWKCYLQGEPFSSARFSAVGEHFAFLKYREEGANEKRVARRTQLEDAVNYRLAPADLGCAVGGGLGKHHSYVLLALQDLGRALRVLLKTLRDNDVPRHAWIQFCDDVLRREWLAVWPGVGAPPGM